MGIKAESPQRGDRFMPTRVLVTEPKNCNGCGLCRLVCSMTKSGARHPARARIRILQLGGRELYLPVICQHCLDAPFMAVCPREAFYRDNALDRVVVDYERCISCRMCSAACPFGAIGFDEERQKVFKCDLCGGQPLCVEYCFPRALAYIQDYRMPNPRLRKSAARTVPGRPIR